LFMKFLRKLIAQFFTGIKYEYQIPCSGCVKMVKTIHLIVS